jgi:PAS domain S-box-containing protein
MTTMRIAISRWKKRLRPRLDRLVEQRWINVGLRAKMGTIVIVGLVGLLTVFALLGISTAHQATQQVLNERVMLARLSAANLDSTIRYVESMLTIVASQEALYDSQASPSFRHPALRAGFDQISSFSKGVYLLDVAGRPLDAVTGPEEDVDWAGVAAVQNALSGGRPSLSVVPGDQPWAVIAVPVLDGAGVPSGSLAALVDLTDPDISPFEQPFDLGPTAILEVVDRDGLALVSTEPDHVLKRDDRKDLLGELFAAGEPTVKTCEGCYTSGSPEPRDQVMAFAPMSQAPWGVVVSQEADEVFAPVRRLRAQTFLLGMVTIIGALGLVWVTTNSVINPVQLLTDAAERIAAGDLATPICCRRGDEIGALAESFDDMRAQLKNSMEQIQTWNRELDARVQERTQAALTAQLEAQRLHDDLRAIIDSLDDRLIVVGPDRRIQQVNKAAQEWFASGEEIAGQDCHRLFHDGSFPCQPPECECPIPTVLTIGESVKVTHAYRDSGNGQKRYFDIVASPMRDPAGRVTRVIELIRDVTAEKDLEEALVRRNEQLSILNAVATTVSLSLDLEDILGRALDEVLRLTEVDAGAIFLKEEMLGGLELLAYRGLSEEAARLASRLGMLDGSCGGVMEVGQVVVVPDLSRYRGQRAESLKRENLSTLVHVPLMVKDHTLGSMCVGTCRQREFDLEEQELLTAIGSQIAVAVENTRLYAEVQHKERIRGELLKKVITAQEEERKRIARELHDDTSQALTALLYSAEEAMDMDDPAEMKGVLNRMRGLAVCTLDGVHKLIFDLRPTMLDHLGLVPALRWFVQSRLGPAGVRVKIEETSESRRLPSEVETALFRVVQEAITNIARHSAARNVHISFHFDDGRTAVVVRDDGIGFDVVEMALSPDSGRGLGLMGMQERVELLGGELEIDTAPGYGTQIRICVPIG